MQWVNFVGSGDSALVSITVGSETTTFKWELAQFVPDFIKALAAEKAAIGPENLIVYVRKFKDYLRTSATKKQALINAVGNYMAQIRANANGEAMGII